MGTDLDKILTPQERLEAIESLGDFEQGMPSSFYAFPMRCPDEREVSQPKRKSFDIQRLWSRHKEIINLNSLGYKNTEIAEMLDIHERTVSNTLHSTLGKAAVLDIREMRDQEADLQRDKIMDLTWMALEVYEETFGDKINNTPKERREAAKDILLEMSGLRAPTKIQSQSVSTVLSAEELNEFKQRGFEASKNAGKLIEVEGE